MRLFSSAPIIFSLSLCAGLWIADHSLNGQFFVFVGEQRSPAAVRSVLDYSSIERKALYRSAHTQLLANAEVIKRDGYAGIKLGHPVLSKGQGSKAFGCQVSGYDGMFNQIEITFVGVGISEGGVQPRMVVDAPCRAQKDLNYLETVWIPMSSILASEAKDQELHIFGSSPINVRLADIPSQWPQDWVLWSIRLYRDDNPEASFMIDASALKEARPKMLSFDWHSATVQ